MDKEPFQIKDIYETYRLVEEINSEYTNEKNQLTEKLNSNELELKDLISKKDEREKKMSDTFQRKEYFSGQFHATSHSILEVSNEIKKSKLKIQQELNKENFENMIRKFNDDYVILLENKKKRIVQINENMDQTMQTHTPDTTTMSLNEKQKELQRMKQSIIMDSLHIEMMASKTINRKKMIEEIEDFLKDYFSKYLSLDALEKLINLSYENIWKQNQKYKYLDLKNFLQSALEIIKNKNEEIKNNIAGGRNNYQGLNSIELQNKYRDYYMEIKSFQICQREFINVLRDGTPKAKELIPLVEKIDMAIQKLAANEENVCRVYMEIENNLQLNSNFRELCINFKESFDKIKKTKQDLKKNWEFFAKGLEKSNNAKLIKEKTNFMLEFSLVFSLSEFIPWWLDTLDVESNSIPQSRPEFFLLDQDDLEIIEKLFLKLKFLNEYDDVKQKEFQIDEVKQKLADTTKLFESLEMEIKAEAELPIKNMKHLFFDLWRDAIMAKISSRHSDCIQTKTTEPNDTSASIKAKEKLKKLKKSLKERMLKDQLEIIRCAKKDKEIASEVEKLNNNISSIEERNKEIQDRLVNLKKEFDEKIAEINSNMMSENETKS